MQASESLLAWGSGWGDEFVWGTLMTLQISSAAFVLAIVLGLVGAAGRLSSNLAGRAVSGIYVTVVRSLPELLVILLIYFSVAAGVEHILKASALVDGRFEFSPFWAAVIALAVVCGAFMTEVLRAAYLAVPVGQIEAALSIGLTRGRILRRIVLPQMLRHALPGMGNLWLNITKDSAIVSVLGAVSELLFTGYRAASATRHYVYFYGLTAAIYLAISLASVLVLTALERRARRGHR